MEPNRECKNVSDFFLTPDLTSVLYENLISSIDDIPVETMIGKSKVAVFSKYGKLVISDINLKIARGEFVGIVGPNGSGKTTLLLSILGILNAKSGRIRIHGCEPMCRSNDGRI